MHIDLVVLNYNGRRLMADCLPSVLRAAEASRHCCAVTVVDNDSYDESLVWLREHYPQVAVIQMPNEGLCSFNAALARLDGEVAILLNNDVRLAHDCVDPWVEPFVHEYVADQRPCFMTAPRCDGTDGRGYEGFKTAVQWRWGLVQATALFAGHESGIEQPDWTASAGAALAVRRRTFLALGGFDPRYLPGRLEDLDFAFRGYQAGYCARYVPEALVYHLGMGTFGPVFGQAGCDALALRNTLLFQWKNLRCPMHLGRQLTGLALRLAADVVRAPWTAGPRRWATFRALGQAARQAWRHRHARRPAPVASLRREREFFYRFHPAHLQKLARAHVAQQSARTPGTPAPASGRARQHAGALH